MAQLEHNENINYGGDMVSKVQTFAFVGIEPKLVCVQVQLSGGANAFTIVGLPDKAVCEARERVRAALSAIGLGLPPKRITVNLAPADLPKEGSHYDLAIALGVMAEMGAISHDAVQNVVVMGELGLDGSIAPVHGALPAAIGANELGLGIVCGAQNGPEAAWAGDGLDIIAPTSLIQLINHFKGVQVLSRPKAGALPSPTEIPDIADVKGQETAKRALEIAAAGGHNLLMTGPPGAGKSMLAARLPSLLPDLTAAEMLEISMVQSVAGLLENGSLIRTRPFRAPHHSASMAAIIGGGIHAKPGEASLAHHGVLFLDELPEFSGAVLDSLRQPLETGDVFIARANFRIRYPARFQLICAMNPCKCGFGRASGRACGQGRNCEEKYQSRISGPMLDRMDLSLNLAPVSAMDLVAPSTGETSAQIRVRVERARALQLNRQQSTNTAVRDKILLEVAAPDSEGAALLNAAVQKLQLSARGYTRILRVARTLADLAEEEKVRRPHIAEAISFRRQNPIASAALGAAKPALS